MRIQDVELSLTRFVYRRLTLDLGYAPASVKILRGTVGIPLNRPVWILQATPGSSAEREAAGWTRMSYRYSLMMIDSGHRGYDRGQEFIGAITQKLQNNGWIITGVLKDFVYPRPKLREIVGAGSLAAQTYHVAVSGIPYLDVAQETLTSRVQAQAVGADGRIELVIPRFPRGFNWFKKYNVYAGTSPTTLKKTADSPIDAHVSLTTVYDLDALPAGAAPPVTSEVKYRFIRIPEDVFSVGMIRDPSSEAESWVTTINFMAEAPIVPYEEFQAHPLASVTSTVESS